MSNKNKAVFLDRDGTINVNQPEYVHKIENFKFTSGAIEALQKLSETDYKLIIITNQSGVGRGYFNEDQLKKLHQWMLDEFKRKGIRIDDIYYCPHHPEDNCECRKPGTKLFQKAIKDLNIDANKSWMVGDDKKDIIAGNRIGANTIKIEEEELNGEEPDYYARNLLEAAKIIINSKS